MGRPGKLEQEATYFRIACGCVTLFLKAPSIFGFHVRILFLSWDSCCYFLHSRELHTEQSVLCDNTLSWYDLAVDYSLRIFPPLVRCLSVLNVHFCKKSPKLAQMTFDRYLSNPDIGRTFLDWLTPSN